MKIRLFTIPNFITCLNLLAGCVGIVCVWHYDNGLHLAMCCLLAAAVFDFFDGFAARLLKSYSAVGLQLDSLADMVSFGVLPAMMMSYHLQAAGDDSIPRWLWVFAPFVLTAFSALRLAKFNVDDRQSISFIGLPVPANALFFGSLTLLCKEHSFSPWLLLLPAFVFAYLLICELPMFSLKVKNFSPRRYAWQIAFVLMSAGVAAGVVLLQWPLLTAFAPIILLYILLSVAKHFLSTK
jgi:CDP-diacylglycerol--serine O-phosphatidyltransferase